MSVRILVGDCRQRLRELPDSSVDSCVCDPPYHLTSIVKRFGSATAAPAKSKQTGAFARASKGFMGQTWDGGDVAFDPETWAEVLRVLKPGGHLVAFSGTRTYHRMAVAIEDAGFEIRDQLAWVYGSGFPKSHNLGDGWGTALKPAWEPIALARKPLQGTNAANMAKHGVGGLNVDGCRIEAQGRPAREVAPMRDGVVYSGNALEGRVDGSLQSSKAVGTTDLGRWPANIIHDGSDEVVAGFPESTDGVAVQRNGGGQRIGSGTIYSGHDGNLVRPDVGYGGSGSAARFFQTCEWGEDDCLPENNDPRVSDAESQCGSCGTPIAGDPAAILTLGFSSAELQAGAGSIGICERCIPSLSHAPIAASQDGTATIPTIPSSSRSNGSATPVTGNTIRVDARARVEVGSDPEQVTRFRYCPKATTEERGEGNNHPTVKPVALMRWLTRLVTPKGGLVLDPFMGSGSTALACEAEQFNFIGCELSPEYAEIARKRIADSAGMFADIQVAA